MAASKYLDLTGAQHLVTKIKAEISAGDLKAVKKVFFDDATRTIKFFKDENALDTATGDFEVIIPDDVDISNLLEKLTGGVENNVVTVGVDGAVKDSGTALADLATKTEVTAISDKIGDLATLDTTEKNSVVGAINEIEGQVSALQAGTYDDSELREQIGTLTDLTTTEQNSLVGAVNELDAEIATTKTEATVTVEENTQNPDYAKTYTIKQNGQDISTINIPKDMVVQSGQIVEDPADLAPGKYLELTIANSNGDKIYIAVADLVDAYTAQAGATQVQLAISGTNEISATIVANSITATELANDAVTTAKILDANVTASKLAEDAKLLFDSAGSATAAQTNAQNYADGLNTAMDARVTALEGKVADGFTAIDTGEIDAMF